MFKIVHENNGQPMSFPCHPSATFEPGQFGQLCVDQNQICIGVSNGRAPIGIIDDIRTKAFSNVSINEIVIVPAQGVLNEAGKYVLTSDIKYELDNSNIIPGSFQSTVSVILKDRNGVITFEAGTELNFDAIGLGIPNAIKTIVNYSYFVPNVPGDDSVAGSGRVTIWYGKMIFETNMFETSQSYPINAPLYVSEYGMLTSRKPSEFHPSIAMVTAPPSLDMQYLQAMLF